MSRLQTISDNLDFDEVEAGSITHRFDNVIEWLLITLLAFMPLAFGTVHAWSKEIVVILSAAITFCFLFNLLYNRQRGIIRTSAYIPIAAFLIIAALQLVPLPAAFVGTISPNTVVIKKELLGDLPNADTLLRTLTISFYSYATKHDLRLVLSAVMVFVVVLNVFRRPEQIKRLLMAIAIIGGAVALITVAQNLFGNGKIYWFVPTRHGNGFSGPFVNHSNYGQFMNLSIGAALAYLFVKLHEDFAHKEVSHAYVFDHFASRSAKTFWLLAAIISLGIATIFISLTRGGMISMLIALVFTTVALTWRRSLKSYSWIMVVIALAAFTCVLYIGFDSVYQRLATLRNFHESQSERLQILKDISVMSTKFPLLGTGLGTHYVVYPMFDRSTVPALAAHAENEYAQVLEETGLTGLCLLIIFGMIIWSSYVKCVSTGTLPITSAAYGLGFGLLAILIHSLSDFGQHLPANAFLSAIFCALLVAIAQQCRGRQYIFAAKFRTFAISVLIVVSGIFIWAIISSNHARLAESRWAEAVKIEQKLVAKNWEGSHNDYDDLISHAVQSVEYDPQNIEHQYWLNVYRWHSIPRRIDSETRQEVFSDDSNPAISGIVAQFHKIRTLCPTYGPAYSVAGQIEKLILNEDKGAEDIKKGFRLAPCDATACFMAGYLDVIEGRTEDCFTKFERAFQLDEGLFADVTDMYIYHLNRPELAIKAAGNDVVRLRRVAYVFDQMQYSDLAEQIFKKIEKLLKEQCSSSGASAETFEALAKIYIRQHSTYPAIECYRRALAMDYSQVYWRLDLARLLAETQQIPEAIREIKICLRVRPGLKEAEVLLEQLSVNPAGFSKDITSL